MSQIPIPIPELDDEEIIRLLSIPRNLLTIADIRNAFSLARPFIHIIQLGLSHARSIPRPTIIKYERLRYIIVNIRVSIARQLTQQEVRERQYMFKQLRLTIWRASREDCANMRLSLRMYWATRWERLVGDDGREWDGISNEMFMWISYMVARFGGLRPGSRIYDALGQRDRRMLRFTVVELGRQLFVQVPVLRSELRERDWTWLRDILHTLQIMLREPGFEQYDLPWTARSKREQRKRGLFAYHEQVPVESLDAENQECSLCTREYGVSDDPNEEACQPLKLKCCTVQDSVIYGSECLTKWFAEKEGCPNCRRNIGELLDWAGPIM